MLGLASATAVLAQTAGAPPATYYASAVGQSGTALRAALHTAIRGHRSLPYSSSSTDVWDAVKVLDQDPANSANVVLLYSGLSVAKNKSLEFSGGTWNREHVWPLSRGPESTGTDAGSDLFHLFPSDETVNGQRGNRPFDALTSGYSTPAEAPLCRYTSSLWEPRDADKGLLARALFYMAVRYEPNDDVSGVGDLELNDSAAPGANLMSKRATLLAWHRAFPATAAERTRNHTIYTTYQFNRNPFIDVPEFADLVFVAGATPASAWRGVQFTAAEVANAAVSGDLADPDADGLPNLLEHLLRLAPKSSDASPLTLTGFVPVGGGSQFEVRHRFNRFATDAALTYETSTDLVAWTPVTPASVATTYVDAVTDERRVRFVTPSAAGARFYVRLRATRP